MWFPPRPPFLFFFFVFCFSSLSPFFLKKKGCFWIAPQRAFGAPPRVGTRLGASQSRQRPAPRARCHQATSPFFYNCFFLCFLNVNWFFFGWFLFFVFVFLFFFFLVFCLVPTVKVQPLNRWSVFFPARRWRTPKPMELFFFGRAGTAGDPKGLNRGSMVYIYTHTCIYIYI